MKALIAGPCISEFGWEVMEWQGYVRKQAQGCDVVVVCSRLHMRHLYADLPGLVFIPHDIECDVSTHTADRMHTPEKLEAARLHIDNIEAEFIKSGYEVCRLEVPRSGIRFGEGFAIDGKQDYKRMGTHYPRVIVHIRNKRWCESSEPNYPVELWEKIIGRLVCIGYKDIGAIGTHADALCLPGCQNFLDIPLDRLCDMLASADIVIGPSSGPMHLASLCQCPQVIWTEREVTADRYRNGWNPFNVPVEALIQSKGEWIDPAVVVASALRILRTEPYPSNRGICYVSVGDDYHSLLETSLQSLRLFYDGPVAVVTDQESNALTKLSVRYKAQIITAPVPNNLGNHARSRWIKTSIVKWTPFDMTAYIDCDTIICNRVDEIFNLISDGNIALTTGRKTINALPVRQMLLSLS